VTIHARFTKVAVLAQKSSITATDHISDWATGLQEVRFACI